jgi:hypothetical protein
MRSESRGVVEKMQETTRINEFERKMFAFMSECGNFSEN